MKPYSYSDVQVYRKLCRNEEVRKGNRNERGKEDGGMVDKRKKHMYLYV